MRPLATAAYPLWAAAAYPEALTCLEVTMRHRCTDAPSIDELTI